MKKQNTFPWKYQKFLKEPLFHCRKYVDEKYLWRSRTSMRTLEVHYKKVWFFHKTFDNSHLKFRKIKKKQKLKNNIFNRPLIVNQMLSQTEFAIGKSDFAHFMHFQ